MVRIAGWVSFLLVLYKLFCRGGSMEKVRGKVFAAFFRKLRGEAKISLLIVALIFSANYHLKYYKCLT